VVNAFYIHMLNYQQRGLGFKSITAQTFAPRLMLHLRHLASSAIMSTLTVHYRLEDYIVGRDRSVVGSMPCVLRVAGANRILYSRHVGTLG